MTGAEMCGPLVFEPGVSGIHFSHVEADPESQRSESPSGAPGLRKKKKNKGKKNEKIKHIYKKEP